MYHYQLVLIITFEYIFGFIMAMFYVFQEGAVWLGCSGLALLVSLAGVTACGARLRLLGQAARLACRFPRL